MSERVLIRSDRSVDVVVVVSASCCSSCCCCCCSACTAAGPTGRESRLCQSHALPDGQRCLQHVRATRCAQRQQVADRIDDIQGRQQWSAGQTPHSQAATAASAPAPVQSRRILLCLIVWLLCVLTVHSPACSPRLVAAAGSWRLPRLRWPPWRCCWFRIQLRRCCLIVCCALCPLRPRWADPSFGRGGALAGGELQQGSTTRRRRPLGSALVAHRPDALAAPPCPAPHARNRTSAWRDA